DPSKDAFGRTKNGVPNRQSGRKLVQAGVPLRWADTHGEQSHVKMLYVEHPDQTATLLLGSSNFTRRNLSNFNCEADLAFAASADHAAMSRARALFDRWWSNGDNRNHTVEYAVFEDNSLWRRGLAWWKENTGMGTF
uniref:phospholipase D-like domain-containing protein n=1 Tax=Pontiella sp. TaxID=2837462 RepID=UPI0035625BB2